MRTLQEINYKTLVDYMNSQKNNEVNVKYSIQIKGVKLVKNNNSQIARIKNPVIYTYSDYDLFGEFRNRTRTDTNLILMFSASRNSMEAIKIALKQTEHKKTYEIMLSELQGIVKNNSSNIEMQKSKKSPHVIIGKGIKAYMCYSNSRMAYILMVLSKISQQFVSEGQGAHNKSTKYQSTHETDIRTS